MTNSYGYSCLSSILTKKSANCDPTKGEHMPFKKRAAASTLDVRVGDQYGTITHSRDELQEARRHPDARHRKYTITFEDGSRLAVAVKKILYAGSQTQRKRRKQQRLAEIAALTQTHSAPASISSPEAGVPFECVLPCN